MFGSKYEDEKKASEDSVDEAPTKTMTEATPDLETAPSVDISINQDNDGVEVVEDLEAGAAPITTEGVPKEHPVEKLKASVSESTRKLQQHGQAIHDTHIRPALQKAGESVRQISEATKLKTAEITEATKKKTAEIAEATKKKTAEFHAAASAKTREFHAAASAKTRELSIGTQIAVAAATAKTSHTISQIGSHPLETHEDGSVKVKGEGNDGIITGVHAYGIQGLAVVSCVSALLSLVMVMAHLVDFMSLLLLVLSPLVFWQKTKLKELGGMRGQQNALREKVNTLTVENNKLTDSIDTMESQVGELQHVEKDLATVAAKAGGQVDRLVSIVHENGQIQKDIKAILQDEILQQIITAVINTDRNQDYRLDKREVRQLEYRLKNIPGVVFHHERFQSFCQSDEGDLTLSDVTNIARTLGDESISKEEQIFEYEPKEILAEKKKAEQQAEVASPPRASP